MIQGLRKYEPGKKTTEQLSSDGREEARNIGRFDLFLLTKRRLQIDMEYQNPTWEDLQLKKDKNKLEVEDRTRLHVAFNDGRRKSTDNVLMPHRTSREIRRCSLNMAMKRDRNR